ncbi:MAG: TadE/TadG family type IV pilus assembly protein [Deltaproteobacteria bacterium]
MRGFIRRERGQALVEMALVIPVLLLLLVGICEFGRILGAYMVINNLAREGARYGVVGHNDLEIEDLLLSERAWLDEERIVVYVNPAFTDRHKGEPLDIQVDYTVDLMTPVFSHILPNPVPISAKCDMRIE